MTLKKSPVADELIQKLQNRLLARAADAFPSRGPDVDHPGLYSWWADDDGAETLSVVFGEPLPSLIYAGQAGATSSRFGTERVATLGSRIRTNHLNGNINSSTFRRTLTAVLFDALGLELDGPSRLNAASNRAVSAWMRSHLAVVLAPCTDRTTLSNLEDEVLAVLDPPLNLMGMRSTPVRVQLRDLRRRFDEGRG